MCHYSFYRNDAIARVACRQLGYEVDNGQSILHYITDFQCVMCIDVNVYYSGEGTGPIWLSYLYCSGNEQNILECPRAIGIGISYCSHSHDVSVVCPGNVSFVTQFVIYFV